MIRLCSRHHLYRKWYIWSRVLYVGISFSCLNAHTVEGSTIRKPRFATLLYPKIRGGETLKLVSLSSPQILPNNVLNLNATTIDIGATPLSSILTTFQTSTVTGLSSVEASRRLLQYGPNKLDESRGKTLFALIMEQFQDKLVQILLAVAMMSAFFSYMEMIEDSSRLISKNNCFHVILQHFVEPVVIILILILNATVGVWQSKSAEGSMEALKKLQPTLATVLRDGKWIDGIDASCIVPGDVISFRVGDKIPADARVLSLQTSTLRLDEGTLTGESVTVEKLPADEGLAHRNSPLQDLKSVVFSGTMVTSGCGTAVVIRTGMNTEMGKIQKGVHDAKADEQKTPLALKLDEFGETLTKIIGFICLTVWMVSIPKWSDPSFSNVWEGAVYYAKGAVALGVAAIPEGLPAVITLCLSLGTRRMSQRNVIVRKLPSVETLGCVSVICTDKTGTLTQNVMTAVSLILFEKENNRGKTTRDSGFVANEYPVEGSAYSPDGLVVNIAKNEIIILPQGSVADCAAVAALCNDAKIVGHDSTENCQYERIGEPTEAALCVLVEKIGGLDFNPGERTPPSLRASANVDAWRRAFPRSATLEFSRDRKTMSVLCHLHTTKNSKRAKNRLLVKGAPNMLVERCSRIKFRDGSVSILAGDVRKMIENTINQLSKRPLRCIALAVKEHAELDRSLKHFNTGKFVGDSSTLRSHPLLSDSRNYAEIESGLTLVGIVGIKDPARPEVASSIRQCAEAGIRVIMITGDSKETAIAIAQDVGIFPPKSKGGMDLKAFEGKEFFSRPSSEQLDLLKCGNLVFCRAEPSDKQKLVKMLQTLGECVGMTGDGVNDAPALQQAAIGIAMGVTGTEVSKEAADMILSDDNFSTIVSAVEEGRRIYANMQSFICFLISCNIGEIFTILLAAIAGIPEPLSAMHLLWVNLVTDGPPATALGFNPPAPDLMKHSPRPSNEPIMTRWLLIRYCLTGLYVGIATLGVFISHYLQRGVSLSQLSSWSKCGEKWLPQDSTLTCKELFMGEGRLLPQTVSLTTLVCMEMLKAFSAVSVDSSIFTVGPHKNHYLVLGVCVPMLLHLIVLYSENLGIPALGRSFGMMALTRQNWLSVLKWSAPILLVEELLKALSRSVKKRKISFFT